MRNFFKKLLEGITFYSKKDKGSIWLLYRIENDKLITYGYYTIQERAIAWADAGGYLIKECNKWF